MGGQKAREINLHPILSRYAGEFEERLHEGGVKLMVVGYGFRDDHINAVISSAVMDRGLKMFVVSPEGSDQARYLNQTRQRGQIIATTPLEAVFERGLIGASRRPMSDTFGGDTAEFNKVQRWTLNQTATEIGITSLGPQYLSAELEIRQQRLGWPFVSHVSSV